MSDDQPTAERGSHFAGRTRRIPGRGGGAEYLDVKWRKLWLLEDVETGRYGENASAAIDTELIESSETHAVFRAVVTVADENGRVVRRGTGHDRETVEGFQDFLAKCETAAIGRALQTIGYGTEALPDDKRIVDSPRETRPPTEVNTAPASNRPPTPLSDLVAGRGAATSGAPANKGQIDGIQRLARLAGLTDAGLAEHLASVGAASLENLTFEQAGKVLGKLQER